MMALLVVMCIDLAANQPVIFGIVMLAAFVGSIGLAYTRVSWQNGAKATAAAALVVSLLAIFTHAFMEASYWSSVIDQINQEVTAERAVSDARAAVAEKRKERYVSSSNGRSAGQIEAELKAAETNILFARSASCDNATAKESRDFCQGYFLLKAKHAAAIEAGQLESVIWSAGTTVETTTKRNLASIAVMASNIFGGQPEQYTALIVVTLVLFTQALLAFALVIGWAPEKPQEAAGAAFQRPISLQASFVDPAYNGLPVAPRTPIAHLEKLTGVKASSVPSEPVEIKAEISPEPDGGGTPIAEPTPVEAETEVADEEDPKIVRPAQWHEDSAPPVAPRTKAKRNKKHLTRKDHTVLQWLADCCSITGDEDDVATGRECHSHYVRYCKSRGIPEHDRVAQARMSTILSGHLGTRVEGRGKRKNQGAVFPGLMINPIVAQARRKVA